MITLRMLTARNGSLPYIALLLVMLSALGCSDRQEEPGVAETRPSAAPSAGGEEPPPPNAAPSAGDEEPPRPSSDDVEPLPPLAYELALPEGMRRFIAEPFTGDLEEMVKRRLIRAGVVYNRTHYFVDKGVQRGASYEYGKLMEDELNKRRKTGNLRVYFWFVPLPRDQLLPALVAGKIDFVIVGLTATPERQKLVDFTKPFRKNVSEVVVTGPGAPAIASVDDLSGQEVFVRKATSYYESLLALNERLKGAGKPPVVVQEAPEQLEDDDLLEMVNVGLVRITIVDDYVAKLWKNVFTDLTVHDAVTLRTGADVAIAIRKNSPQLAAGLNNVIDEAGLGTAFGNIIQKRYFQSTKYVKDATSEAERKKLLETTELFKKYAGQYELDYLLMAAQAYQESQLDHGKKSAVGAVGIMQVMPATGKELRVGDIRELEPNIHAGVKYMRFVIDQYYKDEPMTPLDKGLFAFASYNAGPGRIRQLRREAAARGLDPNVWFGNVEQIASERIGRETVTYVSNIFKYYTAYRLVQAERERRAAAKAAALEAGRSE
jgi:membrane-bound lytic murein transglycosylase MltF